jgi:hypothetical protein
MPPSYSMGGFTASTVPGARVPHVWLSNGRPLLDALGPVYTPLRFDQTADKAAEQSGVPSTLLDVDRAESGYPCGWLQGFDQRPCRSRRSTRSAVWIAAGDESERTREDLTLATWSRISISARQGSRPMIASKMRW